MDIQKIQFVTGIHGNEPIPVMALASLGVDQHVAHQLALARGVRFVETDLNASFGLEDKSLFEARLADKFLKELDDRPVIDLHTTTAKTPPFAIVVDRKMIELARQLPVDHIVYMKHNIKNGHSLINKKDGVSVECGQHNRFSSFAKVYDIALGEKAEKQAIYEVTGIIQEAGEYRNFDLSGDFVPILAGENAYDHYGLKAKLLTKL